MALLQESERQDFWAVVGGAGFSKEDFELEEIANEPTSTNIYAITGTVTVRRKSTGVSRKYFAGHVTIWLTDFETELRDQVFGRV